VGLILGPPGPGRWDGWMAEGLTSSTP
jgi:hypothetical protein